jgi:Arc/MetJ family transcription regulator
MPRMTDDEMTADALRQVEQLDRSAKAFEAASQDLLVEAVGEEKTLALPTQQALDDDE